MFKSAEEREAERQAREAEQARVQAAQAAQQEADRRARQAAAYLASPMGRAEHAKRQGEEFFEVQLEVGGHIGTASLGSTSGQRQFGSSAQVLAAIEQLGWRLEQAGYYFMLTGETSTAQFFGTGQNTAVSGVTVGVYLFRNVRDVPAPAEPSV